MYINLEKVAGKEYAEELAPLKKIQQQLNELTVVDYEEVMKYKFAVLKKLYTAMGAETLASEDFKDFFKRVMKLFNR